MYIGMNFLLRMCTHVYICICVCHISVYIYIWIYIYTHIHMYINIHMYVHIEGKMNEFHALRLKPSNISMILHQCTYATLF
jgi:hypothetical protein